MSAELDEFAAKLSVVFKHIEETLNHLCTAVNRILDTVDLEMARRTAVEDRVDALAEEIRRSK